MADESKSSLTTEAVVQIVVDDIALQKAIKNIKTNAARTVGSNINNADQRRVEAQNKRELYARTYNPSPRNIVRRSSGINEEVIAGLDKTINQLKFTLNGLTNSMAIASRQVKSAMFDNVLPTDTGDLNANKLIKSERSKWINSATRMSRAPLIDAISETEKIKRLEDFQKSGRKISNYDPFIETGISKNKVAQENLNIQNKLNDKSLQLLEQRNILLKEQVASIKSSGKETAKRDLFNEQEFKRTRQINLERQAAESRVMLGINNDPKNKNILKDIEAGKDNMSFVDRLGFKGWKNPAHGLYGGLGFAFSPEMFSMMAGMMLMMQAFSGISKVIGSGVTSRMQNYQNTDMLGRFYGGKEVSAMNKSFSGKWMGKDPDYWYNVFGKSTTIDQGIAVQMARLGLGNAKSNMNTAAQLSEGFQDVMGITDQKGLTKVLPFLNYASKMKILTGQSPLLATNQAMDFATTLGLAPAAATKELMSINFLKEMTKKTGINLRGQNFNLNNKGFSEHWLSFLKDSPTEFRYAMAQSPFGQKLTDYARTQSGLDLAGGTGIKSYLRVYGNKGYRHLLETYGVKGYGIAGTQPFIEALKQGGYAGGESYLTDKMGLNKNISSHLISQIKTGVDKELGSTNNITNITINGTTDKEVNFPSILPLIDQLVDAIKKHYHQGVLGPTLL